MHFPHMVQGTVIIYLGKKLQLDPIPMREKNALQQRAESHAENCRRMSSDGFGKAEAGNRGLQQQQPPLMGMQLDWSGLNTELEVGNETGSVAILRDFALKGSREMGGEVGSREGCFVLRQANLHDDLE